MEVAQRITGLKPGVSGSSQLLYVVEDSKGQFYIAMGYGNTNKWKERLADLAPEKRCSESLNNSKFKSVYPKWLGKATNGPSKQSGVQNVSAECAQ